MPAPESRPPAADGAVGPQGEDVGHVEHVEHGAVKPGPPGLMNVANALTVLRICLVPVFVACLVAGGTGWRIAALAAFGGASLTDFLDGQLARKRGLVTDFGKIADPIADKALTGAALITLSVIGELPVWVTAAILVRELGITALRFAVIREVVMGAALVVTLVTGVDYVIRAVRMIQKPA